MRAAPSPIRSPSGPMRGTTPAPGAVFDAGRVAQVPTRSYEIAALRGDGSLFIGQDKAPAIPLFERAFAAFARGTPILTDAGEIAVEDLQPGDMLPTSAGEPAELVWIGSGTFTPAEAGRRTPLVRIMPDAFGQGRPSGFLTLGPAARLLLRPPHLQAGPDDAQVFTPARAFVDGVNVIEVVPPTPVRLFHLVLTRHAAIRAGGLDVETFHPGTDALHDASPSLNNRFLGMFPRIGTVGDFGPLAHPRAPEAQ